MSIEFEAKVIEVDPHDITEKINACGGQQTGEVFMRRYVYDITPGDKSKWIRLRDTGKEITLTVKEIVHDGIDGTLEVEITVDDFDATNQLLGKLGYQPKGYQENRRTSFILDGARLEIDHWPMIPPYLEIEGESHEHVVQVASKLGFKETKLTGENTIKIYARYGIDLNTIKELRF
ncbi:class IV adenylate cyclase [Paenactinomyces guangxiensis]|uniref:Class IV adenylate cyclase n=1 Tax=Paenactinomyces guangxiensis TaxID=1490290 RepID=A0A7W2A7X8_9BACL|nr:class IV adenylate cyclase [Paenactinomyces guangxiensis]MBA4493263.1 class IV adenylate cyclase [Paenactinomyces guangxiensis]MBH8589886.1 class IV adenylate cyclase [Paenactinomyces guangxiensis]